MKRVMGLMALMLSLGGLPSLAQVASAAKIGFVDFDLAFSLEEEAKNYNDELAKKEREVLEGEQKARTDIESKISSMSKLSEKARKAKEEAISAEINALQQQFSQKRMQLNQERQQILQDLQKKNELLLSNIAKNEGCDLVLNAAVMVYASPAIKNSNDLTAKLVAAYNKAYPLAKSKGSQGADKKSAK